MLFWGLLSFLSSLMAQPINKFKKLSRPEKVWVLLHPFKAPKALIATRECMAVYDKVKSSGLLGTDENGGELDAFRHALWMALLTQKIGGKKAAKLGKAHERGNYLDFKKHRLEENELPDEMSSVMDLKNNEMGIATGKNCKLCSTDSLSGMIVNQIKQGGFWKMKKSNQGTYINCEGQKIDMALYKGKWKIPKCLVPSNAEAVIYEEK